MTIINRNKGNKNSENWDKNSNDAYNDDGITLSILKVIEI